MTKAEYQIADIFMIRSPLLPLKVLDELAAKANLTTTLKKYYQLAEVQEALFIASPGMYQLLKSWLRGEHPEDDEKLLFTLNKYLVRMSSRCTPFGTLAGIAAGKFGLKSEVKLGKVSEHELFIRPDMQYLCIEADQLLQDQKFRETLCYYPNTSLYRLGESYRFVEYFTDKEGVRKYQLQSTLASDELEMVIQASVGGLAFKDVLKRIVNEGVGKEEAMAYINVLIDNQVLVSELEPNVSGKPFMDILYEKLRDCLQANDLKRVISLCNDVSGKDPEERLNVYHQILLLIREEHPQILENNLIQLDMRMGTVRASLEERIKDDLERLISPMMKLSVRQSGSLLQSFKEAFIRRYGDREIPLVHALDAETGPGYLPGDQSAHSSSLIDGLFVSRQEEDNNKIQWSAVDSLIDQKLHQAISSAKQVIELNDGDLESLPAQKNNFPYSFSCMLRMLGNHHDDHAKPMFHIISLGGNSAMNLAGRFSNMDDKLLDTLKKIAAAEQKLTNDSIIAEIIHLPQQRTGNILMRPVIRDYEIPYLARPSVQDDRSIKITDLMLSIKGGKMVLRSKRLNKYIIPRMSNAHNYSLGSLPIYRFLCDLQSQDVNMHLGYAWGPAHADTPFLPRLMYEHFILQAARWKLEKYELEGIQLSKNDDELASSVSKLRETRQLPAEIIMADSDNELWVDLGNADFRRLFRHQIRGAEQLIVYESLMERDHGVIHGEDGIHANEFVFFYYPAEGRSDA